METLISLQLHAYQLSKVVAQFSEQKNSSECTWFLAAEWLHLASSIQSVKVVTEQFDDTLMYCGPAIEYENQKSKTLEKIVKELSIFNFLWGAFETIGKNINPPKVPNTLKKRRNLIDDCLFFLKNNYPLIPAPDAYNDLLQQLEVILEKDPQYTHLQFDCMIDESYCDNAGKGLALIRLIRNDFAHGSHSFPEPDDWAWGNEFNTNDYMNKIHVSSRLLLLTIQMLLISFFKDEPFSVVEWDSLEEEYVNVIEKLYHLHIITYSSVSFGLFYSTTAEQD